MRRSVYCLVLAGAILIGRGPVAKSQSPQLPPSVTLPQLEWLGDRRGDRAMEWVRAQNAATLHALRADPRFAEIYQASTSADRRQEVDLRYVVSVGDYVYATLRDESHPYGALVRQPLGQLDSPNDNWQVLFDAGDIRASEQRNWVLPPALTALRCNAPVFDRCMVGLDESGSGRVSWREFDPIAGRLVVGGLSTPAAYISNIAWRDRNSVYVTAPASNAVDSGVAPNSVRLLARDSSYAAAPVIYTRPPNEPGPAINLANYPDETGEPNLVITQLNSDDSQSRSIITPDDKVVRLPLPPTNGLARYDGVWIAILKQELVAGSQHIPAGSIVSVDNSGDREPAITEIFRPGRGEAVLNLVATPDGILVSGYTNVRGRLFLLKRRGRGWIKQDIAVPDYGTIDYAFQRPSEHAAYVAYEGFLTPLSLLRVDLRTASTSERRAQVRNAPGGITVEQRWVASRDGTRVPYFLIQSDRTRGKGPVPTLLTGYGANGIPLRPYYSAAMVRYWLERGYAFAVSNIRGGGEFGPAWYQAAVGLGKARSYEDFIAVAQDLTTSGVTTRRQLGIFGHSNGGLLVGVMITKHAELFGAAVAEVPIMDLLRADSAFSTGRTRERGSIEVPEERRFMESISPTQNVRSGAPSFPPLLIANTSDHVVHPGQARRFVGRMEELDMPFFYYEMPEGGHTVFSTPQEHALYDALFFTYFLRQLSGN